MSLERLTPKPFMSHSGQAYSNRSYTVSISSGNWGVEGISKNPINFKLGAKWGDLFNGLIPGAEVLQKTGDASLTTGIFSQKYFQGGNNLDLNVEFRIYDDGSSEINPVTEGARNLAGMTVSDPIDIKRQASAINNRLGKTKEVITESFNALTEGRYRDVGDIAKTQVADWMDNINNRKVTLNIQNLVSCTHMAITDVSVTYSPSQTHTGPLFGDFSVSLISLQAITRGGGAYGINDILNRRSYNITIDGMDAGIEGPLHQANSSYATNFIGPRLPG